MRRTGFWRSTDTALHDCGQKDSGLAVANEPKGTEGPGTQPLARRPAPGPASPALPEASTTREQPGGGGGGGGERERRWGAPRPDWPSGRPAVTATVRGHHAQGPEGAGEAPRACGVCRGRGRVWGGHGMWPLGRGRGARADLGRAAASGPGPPTHPPPRINSPAGRDSPRATHTRCTGPMPTGPRATATGRQRHLRPHGAVAAGPRGRGRAQASGQHAHDGQTGVERNPVHATQRGRRDRTRSWAASHHMLRTSRAGGGRAGSGAGLRPRARLQFVVLRRRWPGTDAPSDHGGSELS